MGSRAWGLLLLLGMSCVPASPVVAEPPSFTRTAPGIDYAFIDRHPDDVEPFQIHAFKIDLEIVELRLLSAGSSARRRTVDQIVAPHPVVVAVNASFFDTDGRAIGLGVDEGQLVAAGRRQSWGALVVEGKRARIVLGGEIQDYRAYRLIVQGIPRLVVGGQVQRLKPQVAVRTAVCAAGSSIVIAVATKVETTDFARFLADPPDKSGLGCSDALNLDGGPSTQLVVRLPSMNLALPGWGVPNALVALPARM